jgi:hypothetical protein
MGWLIKAKTTSKNKSKFKERRNSMTVKTNTKAGSAVWGG